MEEQQKLALESIFNTLKLSDHVPSNRSSTTSVVRNYSVPEEGYRPPPVKDAMSDTQRQRSVISRIVNERGLNPTHFDTSPKHARYFVIKSYNVSSFFSVLIYRKMMYIRVSSLIFGRVRRSEIVDSTKRIENPIAQDLYTYSLASTRGTFFHSRQWLIAVVNFVEWHV